jgi:hypothetical protein
VHPMAMDYFKGKYNRVQSTTFSRQKISTSLSTKYRSFTPIGRDIFKTRMYCIFQQSNKAATYNYRVASSRQNSNAMIETYREGKTPGSILCGLVYAHECALLVIIRVYDAKKIPVDLLGTLRTTGTRSL